jgi:ABC-type transporter Mla subunit MlaD
VVVVLVVLVVTVVVVVSVVVYGGSVVQGTGTYTIDVETGCSSAFCML